MYFVGIIILFIGVYLVDSGARNRSPLGTIKALIDDPSDVMGTVNSLNGQWYPVTPATDSFSGGGGVTGSFAAPSGESGHLSDSDLQRLSWVPTQRLIPAAANALEQLNVAYRSAFGTNLSVTDSYRSYAAQVATKAAKGRLAATPGKSNHGWGTAVDLGGGIQTFNTQQYLWMKQNAARFQWMHPSWAEPGGSTPEPWHWEFTGATSSNSYMGR